MHYTFVSPVSCYVGVKTFLMYALYFCQPCLMLCRCEDLSDVCTILLSALSHVMQVWRSFWCMYYTFVSPLSCYVGVKIFLMYALYFCQPCLMLCRCEDLPDVWSQSCLMLCRCEDLSDVCTILLSALSHVYVGVKSPFWCRCEDLSDVCTILLSALSHVM